MEEVYDFYYCGYKFPKDPSDKDKYVVITCAKNEEDYIVEWIEHYLSLGFDKIFIADNNDEGNDGLINVTRPYVERGVLQIFDLRGVDSIQVGLYANFCQEANFKWCAFYDCDEFLDIGIYKDIKEYLEQFNGYDVVMLNWLMFGPNGQLHKEEGGIQERFPLPISPVLYFKDNCFIKSMVRGNREKFKDCFFNGSHVPTVEDGKIVCTLGGIYNPKIVSHGYFIPRYKNGYIKHYYTKSFDEWLKKAGRGWPDGTENLALAKYMIFDESKRIPMDFMENAIFKVDDYSAYESFKDSLTDYDVILVKTSGEFLYPLLTEIMDIMKNTKGNTYVFNDECIDDATFAILLEYGYITGNRVVYCKNDDDVWKAYLKFGKKNITYYVINFG